MLYLMSVLMPFAHARGFVSANVDVGNGKLREDITTRETWWKSSTETIRMTTPNDRPTINVITRLSRKFILVAKMANNV